MKFDFTLTSDVDVAALAIVSGHGATDIDVEGFWMTYAAVAILPDFVVSPLFLLCSLAHFSQDVGVVGSAMLHWSSALVSAAFGVQRGGQLMFLYLLIVHTPLHYMRSFQKARGTGLFSAAVVSVLAFFAMRGKRAACLGEWRQRAVIAHVVNELISNT